MGDFRVAPFSREFGRSTFACGEESLDDYLRRGLGQDVRRNLAACYVLHEKDSQEIVGFYTLSSFALTANELPEEMRKKLPYPRIPTTMLGRLAVDRAYHGKGLGEFLLMDALLRSFRTASEIASSAVIVDCLHEKAAQFYSRYGFRELQKGSGWRLFLPMMELVNLVGA